MFTIFFCTIEILRNLLYLHVIFCKRAKFCKKTPGENTKLTKYLDEVKNAEGFRLLNIDV